MSRYRVRRLVRKPQQTGARFKTEAERAMAEAEQDEVTAAPPEVERSFNRGCMGCTTAFFIFVLTLMATLVFGKCIR